MMTPAPATTSDRRPIASRELAVFRRMADVLVRAGVSANAISIAGLACAIGAGVMLFMTSYAASPWERVLWVAAGALVPLRLLANMLDGMVAIGAGSASRVGELYNEVPDRIADAAVLIGLGYAAGGSPTLGFVGACLAIMTAYIRAVGKAAGAPSDFRGPMGKQQRMFLVCVAALYCGLAPAAWQPRLNWLERSWGIASGVLVIIVVGCVVTCARRLAGVGSQLKRMDH